MQHLLIGGVLAVALSLPVALVVWLVIEAEKAREVFRPTRTCRRG